jgi:RNA polymerase sigma-70 factor (ECF subfamily)
MKETVSLDEYPVDTFVDAGDDVKLVPAGVLMRFIAELPDGYRTVFNLHAFEELSHKEIAERLHVNESSSRSQLTRAKAILSGKVKNYIRQHE